MDHQTHPRHGNSSHSFSCRKGHENLAGPLFQRVLQAMTERGLPRAFAAYRGDWPAVLAFFQDQGFRPVREMVNFVLDLVDMPTPAARPASLVSPLQETDVRVL